MYVRESSVHVFECSVGLHESGICHGKMVSSISTPRQKTNLRRVLSGEQVGLELFFILYPPLSLPDLDFVRHFL